jgi:sulfite exporter TauE/SafE
MIYTELFLIGLLGSMHCIGMCGGFVALYALRKPADMPSWPYHLLFNTGRITTYALLGGVLGQIGSFVSAAGPYRAVSSTVLVVTGMVMVLMGLNIAGVIGKRALFDDIGITDAPFFRSALHRMLSFRSVWGTFLFGMLLGLLPCGLLYPVLVHAASCGGFLQGASTSLVFGLGTAPAMMSFGSVIGRVRPHMKVTLYRVSAAIVILLGLQSVLRGFAFAGLLPHGRFW